MKVIFKFGIRTYSGTVDEMTFGSYRKDTVCIGRKFVMPQLTANNGVMGEKIKNLAAIYAQCTPAYKADLKVYAHRNSANVPEGKIPPNAYAIFIRMLFKFAELDSGHIDLATVSYEDLQTVGADIASVADAVASGYLDSVKDADQLVAVM